MRRTAALAGIMMALVGYHHVAAINVTDVLGTQFVDELQRTDAELPLPMIPGGLTESTQKEMKNLKRSFRERETVEEGESIEDGAKLRADQIRLDAVRRLKELMERHGEVHLALNCADRQATFARRRAALNALVNQSATGTNIRESFRRSATAMLETRRVHSDATRRKLVEAAQLLDEQRRTNYSNLHLADLFDGVLNTMYSKLNASHDSVKTATTQQDQWMAGYTASHVAVTADLRCQECVVAQAILKSRRNSTNILGPNMCPAATTAVNEANQRIQGMLAMREEVFRSTEELMTTITKHRDTLRKQTQATAASLDALSIEVFGSPAPPAAAA